MSIFKKFSGEEKEKVIESRAISGKTIEERIAALESEVGTEEKEEEKKSDSYFGLSIYDMMWVGSNYKKTLREEAESIRKDFEELDHKFDLLERYLEIEYFKVDEKTATYDWADKTSNEGFRKAKKGYAALKAEKEAKSKEDSRCCD